jgi:hypothetical protein
MATSWFIYTAAPATGHTLDPLFYNTVSVTPSCSSGTTICAIFATVQLISSVRRPIITATLNTEILAADANNVPSSNVKLKFP